MIKRLSARAGVKLHIHQLRHLYATELLRRGVSIRVVQELLISDGMWHVPIGNGSGVPELQLAYDEMIKFFRRHLGI